MVLGAAARAGAQSFKALTFFRVIETEHFDIIFPRESESSARLLASYADRVYEEVSGLLGIEVHSRIPVTFTPHTDLFNGYMNPVPYPHIMLFDTPMDPEWTSFADNLESLFRHELTHAVSLSSRGPFLGLLHRVFGGWVYPAGINAPLFMVEGVTLSFESLSGFGRANDPLVKHKLRQALYEDKLLTPFQASGVYDLPGQEGAWYEYGGLFSAWLQKNYGMEKYARLWQALGGGFYFSFFAYRSGFYHFFKDIYGMDFMHAWNDFGSSLALEGLEESAGELPVFSRRGSRQGFIKALDGSGDLIYALDSREQKIHVYNARTGSAAVLNAGDGSSYDIDVSPDGSFFLLSGYRYAGDRALAVVREYDADTGRKTGRSFGGLYKARYFRDGVIALRSELHNTSIVYEGFDGRRETLLRGNEGLVFSGPQALDDERIVFIAARRGVRELWLYNYVSHELFRFETLPEEAGLWRYMRGLGVSEGKILFSYNDDDRMYKLALIDPLTLEAVFSGRDFSGGVFSPVLADGSVYYRGAFFSRDGLLRFPEEPRALSGRRIQARLVPLNGSGGPEEPGVNAALAGIYGGPETEGLPAWPGESRAYHALGYMNPFKLWLPLLLVRIKEDVPLSLDGGGLVTVMMDPADRNLIMLFAYADLVNNMAMIDSFSWRNTSLGIPIDTAFSDKVIYSKNGSYRDTRGSLSGTLLRGLGGERVRYGFSLGGGFAFTADKEDGVESAYQWTRTGSAYTVFAGLELSSLKRQRHQIFGNGVRFSVKGASVLEAFEPRYEGVFQAGAETLFPLGLTLYGAYDRWGMDLQGVSRTYGDPLFAQLAAEEYPSPRGLTLNWLSGGEAALGLFSLEVQDNISHVYTNRIYGTLALRSVVYDARGSAGAEGVVLADDLRLAQSLIFKLGMVYAIIPLKAVPLFLEPHFWAAWKFSDTLSGEGVPWRFGLGVNINY
jgi:hypothetical protein